MHAGMLYCTYLVSFPSAPQVGQPSTMCSLVWKLPQWCVRG